jgi:outer membrane protein assembly factor BamB
VSERIEELYRAGASGGDLAAVRAELRALGAAPTPWTQEHLGGSRARLSAMRGARAGRIAAKVKIGDFEPVGARDDGALVVASRERIGLLEPTTFAWTRELFRRDAGVAHHAITSSGVLTMRTRPNKTSAIVSRSLEDGRVLARVELDGALLAPGACSAAGVLYVPYSTTGAAHLRALGPGLETRFDVALAATKVDAVAVGRAIVGIATGTGVVALDAASGTLWKTGEGFEPRSLLVDARDRLVVARASEGFSESVVAMDGTSVTWTFGVQASARANLAATADGGCVVATHHTVARLDADGGVAWTRPITSTRELVVDREGYVYLNTADWGICALDASTGETVFQTSEPGSPVAIDALGRLIALHGPPENRTLIAIE